MRYSQMPLNDLISFFLSQGKEGDFWDFKQEWHDKTEDLIKDIICFANTSHDENCYLIFGIADNGNIVGMSSKRREQSDIIDAISNLPFAGDNLPSVSVETILFDNTELDVLIVHNTNATPIYLKKPYGKMKQGCIYARVGDRNTPDDGNAEIGVIEQLWRKRFGLMKPPLEYIYDSLLNKLEWIQSEYGYYHIFRPEYTLEYEVDEDMDVYSEGDEFYSYTQVNESTLYSMLDVNVNHTTVDKMQIVTLDSGRLSIPVPRWGYIDLDDYHEEYISYKYYIRNSHVERLLSFMFDSEKTEQRYAYDNLMKVILVFESDDEKKQFENYVSEHISEFELKLKGSEAYQYIETGELKKTEFYKQLLRTGLVLNEMLIEYKEKVSLIREE